MIRFCDKEVYNITDGGILMKTNIGKKYIKT